MPTPPRLNGLRRVTSYFPSFALLDRPLDAVLVTVPMVSKSASTRVLGFFFDSLPPKSICSMSLIGLGQHPLHPSSAGSVCISRTG